MSKLIGVEFLETIPYYSLPFTPYHPHEGPPKSAQKYLQPRSLISKNWYVALNYSPKPQTRARPCFSCRLGSGPQRARRAPATAVDRRAAPVGRLETSPPVAQEELASWAVPTLCPACKGSRGVQPHKYYNTLKPGKKSSHSYAMLFCKTVKGPPWPSGPPAAADA